MLGERVYRFLGYATRTPILYMIMKQSNFLDVALGGTNPRPLYFENYPCQPLPPYLDEFYIFKISFHLYELFHTLLLDRQRDDFPEYVLHHMMTWALIHFSYATNIIPVGAAIMLIHDASDIPVTVLKLVVDITNKQIEVFVFVILFTSWCYLRLWVFPFKLIHRLVEECYYHDHPALNFSVVHMIVFFLCSLVALHLFWTWLMIKGVMKRSGKRKGEVLFKDSASRID